MPDALKQLGSIVDAHVEVRGLCEKCQKQPESKQQRRPQMSQDPVRTARTPRGGHHE